jgi:hypothetical protein
VTPSVVAADLRYSPSGMPTGTALAPADVFTEALSPPFVRLSVILLCTTIR